MHELETIAHRRDELDDQELAYLEEQSELADEVARLDAELPELDVAGGGRRSRPDGGRGVDRPRSWRRWPPAESSSSPASTPRLLERYERLRARLGGVAVARLEGSRCGGCHLDLSTSRARRRAGRRRGRVRRVPAVRAPARALTGGAPMFLWFVGDGGRHRVVRVPRPTLRLPAADRRLRPAAARRRDRWGRACSTRLVFSLVLLVVVMLRPSAAGRRASCWLGLPIGTMLHLVFDGAWADSDAVLVAARRVGLRRRRAARGGAWLAGPWRSSSPGGDPGVGLAASNLSDPARAARFLRARSAVHATPRREPLWDTLRRADPRPPRPHRAERGRAPAGPGRRAARRGRHAAGEGRRRPRRAGRRAGLQPAACGRARPPRRSACRSPIDERWIELSYGVYEGVAHRRRAVGGVAALARGPGVRARRRRVARRRSTPGCATACADIAERAARSHSSPSCRTSRRSSRPSRGRSAPASRSPGARTSRTPRSAASTSAATDRSCTRSTRPPIDRHERTNSRYRTVVTCR